MAQENEISLYGYGQVVIGPPGSGKTTYCFGMAQYLCAIGRNATIINLDPANEHSNLPYYEFCKVDIRELVCLEEVMERFGLGPNGGLVYCLEYLEANLDWLSTKLQELQPCYFLLDLPGQVELFTHHESTQHIVASLVKLGLHLSVVNLIDAYHCSDASRFIAATLLSLTTMLRLELPHVNVLSKVDLLESYGELPFNLDFFTDVVELDRLLAYLNDEPMNVDNNDTDEDTHTKAKPVSQNLKQARFARLHQSLCDVIEEFGLVSFWPLHIEEKETVGRILAQVDKSNGFVLIHAQQKDENTTKANELFRSVFCENEPKFEWCAAIQEKYAPHSHENHLSELQHS